MPAAQQTGTTDTAAAAARSVPIMIFFFGYRSPATPAGSARTNAGTVAAAASSDTWPGEASSSSTAITGSATPWTEDPARVTASPTQYARKDRLVRRGGADAPSAAAL
ncbi:hypothetical protein ADK90_10440 [Streptomyces sp. XY413]|nr:hypothetical protein ADK90_10440 [Streptomyces sp. XY413]